MATVVVKHHPSGGPADPLALVDGPTYDADPHIVTGLENVDNTSDVNKPVSTAQAVANAVVAANAANASNLTSGTVPAARLPVPTASTLGGIESLAAVSHNWINSISTSGVPAASQPAFTDISGNIAVSQMNSGTSASSATFWRGDGTWKAATNATLINAVGDGVGPVTSSITTGTNILTRPSGTWAAGDVGKLILVNGAGGSASTPLTTTIAGFTNPTTITLTANATSTATSQSCYYGTDNTSVINTAWSTAAAQNGGLLLLGPGTFCCAGLSLVNGIGITLAGAGRQSGAGPTNYGTHLWPLSTLNGGSGNAIDMSGSTFCGLRNMQIGRSDILQNMNVGLLVCSKLGSESTEHIFEDILIVGNFARAAIYQYGVPNVTYRNVIAYTYANSSLSFAATFTTSNVASISSSNNTLNTGAIELTNVWMENCQLIDSGNGSSASNSHACLLDGVDSWTFINGLMGGASVLGLCQINDATANWGSRNINIINSSMQGFVGCTAPVFAINVLSSVTIWGLKLAHLRFSDGSNAHNSNAQNPSTAMLNITPNPGTLINNLRIEGHPQLSSALINGGGGSQVSGDGWFIEAGGCPINEPGSIVRSTYVKPGTVTLQSGATSARYGRTITKVGTGVGNYSMSSGTTADVDATNLALTTVIPTGMGLLVTARAAILNGTAGDGVMLIIADSTTAIEQQDVTSPAGGQVIPCFIHVLITGDDASHTIKLRWNNITAGTVTMRNSNAAEAPKMTFQYVALS